MTPEEIKKLRLAAGMTQPELALYLGLKRWLTISDYENGRRHPSPSAVKLLEMLRKKVKL